jgi:membrane-associated phospholipid phosphatase
MNVGNLIKTSLSKSYLMIFLLIKRLLALLEFFLFLRLILKFLSANPQALIVNLLYKSSDIFVSPFEFIFPNIYWPKDYLIETATISAMVGYALLVLIFFQILRLFSKDYL